MTDQTDADRDNTQSGWRTIRKVSPYLWPKDQAWVKWRVTAALFMLLLSKIISVLTPFFYKGAVDTMAPGPDLKLVFLC